MYFLFVTCYVSRGLLPLNMFVVLITIWCFFCASKFRFFWAAHCTEQLRRDGDCHWELGLTRRRCKCVCVPPLPHPLPFSSFSVSISLAFSSTALPMLVLCLGVRRLRFVSLVEAVVNKPENKTFFEWKLSPEFVRRLCPRLESVFFPWQRTWQFSTVSRQNQEVVVACVACHGFLRIRLY